MSEPKAARNTLDPIRLGPERDLIDQLSSRFGLIASGAYLLSGAACTLIALAINRQIDGRDK